MARRFSGGGKSSSRVQTDGANEHTLFPLETVLIVQRGTSLTVTLGTMAAATSRIKVLCLATAYGRGWRGALIGLLPYTKPPRAGQFSADSRRASAAVLMTFDGARRAPALLPARTRSQRRRKIQAGREAALADQFAGDNRSRTIGSRRMSRVQKPNVT